MQYHAMLLTVFHYLQSTDEILKYEKSHECFPLFIKKGKKRCAREL